MPVHREQKRLPWSAEQLYDLVADVGRYPEFIPWCIVSRIRKREGDVFWADLVIGFKVFRERFTSKVILTPSERIDVSYTDGPFKHMRNRWLFIPQDDGSCIVDFDIDFEFRSKVLHKAIGVLFHEAVRRMVRAFEARAHDLYGPGRAGEQDAAE
ncbi:MAG: type II toxin-antitoxin system RatA family toxin [Rhodospirillales bacterium]|nr:type II toxin-antitoxin system RatA family toxin [Rhodospirillales bacterium]